MPVPSSTVDRKSKNAMPGGGDTFVPAQGKKKHFSEDEYELISSVPIFDEHKGAEEEIDEIDFTPEVLQMIIDRCNQRIKDTGDFPVVTDGHSEGDKEAPVLGFADNFQLGEIGNIKPRKCIYADLHIRKDKVGRARELPRRSIELWLKDLTTNYINLSRPPIDTVSLLGATRPARDLGNLIFAKKSESPAKYKREVKMVDQAMLEEVLKAVCELPAFKWIEDQMKAAQAPAETPAEEPAKAEYEEEKHEDKPKDEEHKDEVSNFEEEEHKDEKEVGPEKLRMQYDQQKRRYAKLDSDYKALFAKVGELERKERVADRKAQLMQLEAEGFQFDMAEEIELVQDYEPAKFAKHLSHIKKNYKAAPVGVKRFNAVVPDEAPAATKSPRDVMIEATNEALKKYSK